MNPLDLLPILLFVLGVWGAKKVPFNDNFLSLATSKQVKGFFALFIVLYHISKRLWEGDIFLYITHMGYVGVAVFFFFSGFGVLKKEMTTPNYQHNFLLKHLVGLGLPYAIATAIFILIQYCNGYSYSWQRIFLSFLFARPTLPNSWYITAIAIFYIAFALLIRYFRHDYKKIIFGISIYYVLWVSLCLLVNMPNWWFVSNSALVLGALVAWREKQITSFLKQHYATITIAAVLTADILYLHPLVCRHALPGLLHRSIFSCIFVVLMLLFLAKFKIGNKCLSFLGNIYLEIYLVHGIFIWAAPMQQFYNAFLRDKFLWSLLVIAGGILGGYLLHLLCKKPLQLYNKWLQQR